MAATKIKAGDLVRVRQSSGRVSEQRYEVVSVHGMSCLIRQWPSTARDGGKMASQPFDLSLLKVDNRGPALLRAHFRFGR